MTTTTDLTRMYRAVLTSRLDDPGLMLAFSDLLEERGADDLAEAWRWAVLNRETCRGGFGHGELIAYLFARSFPKDEWRQRVDMAFAGAVTH